MLRDAGFPVDGAIWAGARWALAVADLGAGRLDSSVEHLQAIAASPVSRCPHVTYFPITADHVEAAVRLGHPESVQDLLGRLQGWASATSQPWALALAHRCAALADPAADAETEYRGALRLHAAAGRRFDHARTSLLFGEWLRRTKRAAEARPILRDALITFENSGLSPWAARARSELRASGGAPPADGQAGPVRLCLLTPQELQVVRLAASGQPRDESAGTGRP